MNAEEIILQMQNIREKNNRNWMDLMRLAFKFAPNEAKSIMGNICECDADIHQLTRKLADLKEN